MSLALDGSAHGHATSTTITASLTTTSTNDYIIVATVGNSTISGVSSAALGAFTNIATAGTGLGSNTNTLWAIFSAGTLSADTITVTQAQGFEGEFDVFGVSGSNQSSLVWDAGGPVTSANTQPSDPLSFTNANANVMLIASFGGVQFTPNPTAGTGFTAVPNSSTNNMLTEYDVLSATGTTSCGLTTGSGLSFGGIVVGVVQASATAATLLGGTSKLFAPQLGPQFQFQPQLAFPLSTIVALPFNQYDWSKSIRVPTTPFDLSVSLNPNIQLNPIPIKPIDWTPPVRLPHAPYDLSVSLNNNLFLNPVPINQFDWSKPFRVPRYPLEPDQSLNINLYTNPIPVFNPDPFVPKRLPRVLDLSQPYNSGLYTVVIVNLPFNQYDYSPPRRSPLALPDTSVPLNLNLFTNPVPPFTYVYTPQHALPPTLLDQSVGFLVQNAPVVTVTLIQRTLTGVGL